jgi:hypothetical protein
MDRLSAPQQNAIGAYFANLLRKVEQDSGPEFLPRGLDVMGLVRQLALPSAETVEKLSYGDPLFRMPTQSNIPITTDRGYVAEVLGMAPAVPAASRATTRISNEMADQLVRAITGNPQATAPAALEAAGQMAPLARMFKPEEVKKVIPETKVVDEENLPLPVFRGYQTGTGRNEFTFYTSKPELADMYATKLGESKYRVETKSGDQYFYDTLEEAQYGKKYEHGGKIEELDNAPTVEQSYLDFRNPLVVDAKDSSWNTIKNPFADPDSVKDYEKELASVKKNIKIGGRLYTKEQQISDINNKYYFQIYTDTNRLAELAKENGYDGLVVKNVYDIPSPTEDLLSYKSDVYVAFEPNQIKSAISDPTFAGLLNE